MTPASPVIGLDLSLTSSGIADHTGALRLIRTSSVDHDFVRRSEIAGVVAGVVRCSLNGPSRPPLVVIEAVPTHGAHNMVPLAMLHGVVLDRLWGAPTLMVGAMQRAGFACGSGHARKEEVLAAALAEGAPIPERPKAGRDDLADAAWLRWIGLATLGEWVVERRPHRVALVEKLTGVAV